MEEKTSESTIIERTIGVDIKEGMPDWEVVMRVINPKNKRPRRCSLHTLAHVTGRDPLELAKEMQESKKVLGYRCPDVQTLIFYLVDLCKLPGMIDTRDAKVWTKVPALLEEYPYPKVKGFRRFAKSTWTGGTWGKGTQVKESSGMESPFEYEDRDYALRIREALESTGFTPTFKVPRKAAKPEKV